jgi:hypothetical protein
MAGENAFESPTNSPIGRVAPTADLQSRSLKSPIEKDDDDDNDEEEGDAEGNSDNAGMMGMGFGGAIASGDNLSNFEKKKKDAIRKEEKEKRLKLQL